MKIKIDTVELAKAKSMLSETTSAYLDERIKKVNDLLLDQMESYGYSMDWVKEYGKKRSMISKVYNPVDGSETYTVAVDMEPLFQVVVTNGDIEVEETPEGPTYRMVSKIYAVDLTGKK